MLEWRKKREKNMRVLNITSTQQTPYPDEILEKPFFYIKKIKDISFLSDLYMNIKINLLTLFSTKRSYTKRVEKTASTFFDLATLYHNRNQFREAEKAYIEALNLREILASRDPIAHFPNVASTLHSLAILYSSNRKPSQAKIRYNQALKLYKKLNQVTMNHYRSETRTIIREIEKIGAPLPI